MTLKLLFTMRTLKHLIHPTSFKLFIFKIFLSI